MVIGLLGLGTIGSGIYEHLLKREDIEVKRILELLRHPGLEHLETSDYSEILDDPEIDTVVELIGGIEPAHTFTVQALKAGKNVVSANKLMLSHHMEEILTLAREMGVEYRYDASVGGSIPFLYNLARHGSADRLTGVWGIVNGTTNLILDIMQTEGRAFDDVLAEAQRKDCRLVSDQGESLLRVKFMDLEEKLLPLGFLKIHRSFLVNPRYIFRIGKTSLVLTSGEELPISRGRAEEIKTAYLHYLSEG